MGLSRTVDVGVLKQYKTSVLLTKIVQQACSLERKKNNRMRIADLRKSVLQTQQKLTLNP